MYTILQKLEAIDNKLSEHTFRGKRKTRGNHHTIILVSNDENSGWMIANPKQREAIHAYQKSRRHGTLQKKKLSDSDQDPDGIDPQKPRVEEFKIKSCAYTFFSLSFGHKGWTFMESDISKKQGKNLKREFLDITVDFDDNVDVDSSMIDRLTVENLHEDPRGPTLIFKLDDIEVARRGAPGVDTFESVMSGNYGGM